ncbi:MAG TPA: glycosyltransferase family 39 protein, partial [Candidatus Nitrosotenuis sp.]|nr:glycosyltransferase family 39 protein [Candidatus Nitrosotenuis sp.]
MKLDRRPWLWLALGALLRAFHLGRPSLWADEGYTWFVATLPLGGASQPTLMGLVCGHDAHPPLYYLILKGWLALTWRGQGPPPEWLLRLPSWAFSVLTLYLAWRLAEGLLPPARARAVLALLAVMQAPVWTAQEVRMYPLLSLLVVAAALAAVAWWQGGRPAALAGFVAASALAFYTHYLGLLAAAAAWLWAGLTVPLAGQGEASEGKSEATRRRWRGWLRGMGVLALLVAPWLPVLGHQVATGQGPAPLAWAQRTLGPGLAQALVEMVVGPSFPLRPPAGWAWWALAAGMLGLLGWALARTPRPAALLAGLMLLGPPVVLLLASLASGRVVFQARYFIYLAPFAALPLGTALARHLPLFALL